MSALLISYVYIVLISYNNKYDCKTLKHLAMNNNYIKIIIFKYYAKTYTTYLRNLKIMNN